MSVAFLLASLGVGVNAYATSGACSYHDGVNCNAGAASDGSVICNDGWTDSSVQYSAMTECGNNGYCDFGAKCKDDILDYYNGYTTFGGYHWFYNLKMDEYYYSIYGKAIGYDFTWTMQCIEDLNREEEARGAYSGYGNQLQTCTQRQKDAFSTASWRACFETKEACDTEYQKAFANKMAKMSETSKVSVTVEKEIPSIDESIPENSHYQLGEREGYKYNWTCDSGYEETKDSCMKIKLPENAKLSGFGNEWVCEAGYQKAADGKKCVAIEVPANASLSIGSKRGWKCNYGYNYAADGTGCSPIRLPKFAKLSDSGTYWNCVDGFVKMGDRCSVDLFYYRFWIIGGVAALVVTIGSLLYFKRRKR